MAGRPFGADDSSPVREPGNTSLLSTMLKPGLSGMPMRPPGPTATNSGPPMTDSEHLSFMDLLRNMAFAKQGPYMTQLSPQEDQQFQAWVKANNVNYSPNDTGYDMKGYWKDLVAKGRSATGIDPVDHKVHYVDTYKTPFSVEGFSSQSKYASPDNPFQWFGRTVVDTRTGQRVGGDPASTIPRWANPQEQQAYKDIGSTHDTLQQFGVQDIVSLLRQMRAVQGAGSPF